MKEVNYITEEKRKALISELHHLKTIKRKEIERTLAAAKALGDLSENAEYHQAREDQGKTEDRINKIEYMLQTATVVVKKHSNDKVLVGATVKVKKGSCKDLITYHIVGSEEADMNHNKISYKSPIGEALFGKTKNEVVTFQHPKD